LTPELAEHFFRHQYAKLVATLVRRVGVQHIEMIEDAVQASLMKAIDVWTRKGQPENPSAWLYKVALNEVLNELRQRWNHHDLLAQHVHELPQNNFESTELQTLENVIEEDTLRMLFVCSDPLIAEEAQLVFALKNLCGFSVAEISLRLFTTKANIYKRLARARKGLKKTNSLHIEMTPAAQQERLPAVLKILYLLFTEGYLSSHPKIALRKELCFDAIRLTILLAAHPIGNAPETAALLALMHLHVSRMSARENATGGLLLLEEQDRSLWDRQQIHIGMQWLAKSAEGQEFSRYHAEAGIAVEHCLAPSFTDTKWEKIIEYYDLLEHISPSPVHLLNKAIALSQWQGAKAGLELVLSMKAPLWLKTSYLWTAVLADLYRQLGHVKEAEFYREKAIGKAPNQAVKKLLKRRLGAEG